MIESKENVLDIAMNTSKLNYIDPRIVVSWCSKHNLPLSKVYSKALENIYKWAIDSTPLNWDYENTPLLPNMDKLQPKILTNTCISKKTSSRKSRRISRKIRRKAINVFNKILDETSDNDDESQEDDDETSDDESQE